MSSKEWRNNDNICDHLSLSKDFNFDTLINSEVISTCHDDDGDGVLIWLDASINRNERDDLYSLTQLRLVIHSIIIFTKEPECLKFINKVPVKNKLFLVVSGSLGRNFVSKICHLPQINSIYIFCGKKMTHETWAKNYEKIKGVFDNINELCVHLKSDKQKLEQKRMCQMIIDSLAKKSSLSYEFNELINLKNSKYDDHQPKDEMKITVISADVPFSKEETCLPIKEVEISNNIQSSQTVAPYMQYKQQMEFADTGIWPCVSVIDSTRSELFRHLHSAIEIVKYFNSIENCFQHIHSHPNDPHSIVLSNPENIEHLFIFIRLRVRKVYIYCSNNRINEYDTWSKRYPNIVSVLQHFDTLTRLILWDLSACIVDIGNYYDNENKTNLAQARYRYAYRLHVIIQGDLNNRIEMIEYNQVTEFNNQ